MTFKPPQRNLSTKFIFVAFILQVELEVQSFHRFVWNHIGQKIQYKFRLVLQWARKKKYLLEAANFQLKNARDSGHGCTEPRYRYVYIHRNARAK